MPKKKALVATGNSMLTIVHALLADPGASYHDLGPGYYEQRMHARRQALPPAQPGASFSDQVTINEAASHEGP